MEFLPINRAKLKIQITKEELDKYGIDPTRSDYDESCLRGSIGELLALANSKCSFTVGNERVLVQLYPSDKGADIFITKLSIMTAKERRAVDESTELTTYGERETVFCFTTFSDLLRGVRAVGESEAVCDLYRLGGGSYYLCVRERALDGITPIARLTEYGSKLPSLPKDAVGEYGICIFKGEKLSLLARM